MHNGNQFTPKGIHNLKRKAHKQKELRRKLHDLNFVKKVMRAQKKKANTPTHLVTAPIPKVTVFGKLKGIFGRRKV